MTLFELAVVLLIALILCVLAIFSIQTLVTRTKVSRVRQDHRAVSRALQNYILDYSTLPAAHQGLSPLTHPTVYLGSVPTDPFQRADGRYLYLVPGGTEIAAVLISPGPDGQFELPMELWRYAARHDVAPSLAPDESVLDLYGGAPTSTASHGEWRGRRYELPMMSESESAILSTYLRLGRYDPEKGPGGDIITVVRY